MSKDLSRNILTQRYGARIQEGQQRWRESMQPVYAIGKYDPVDFTYIETRSVQIDLHPADFDRLVEAVEFLHDDYNRHEHATNSTALWQSSLLKRSSADRYAEHIYKKEWRDEELRKKHPLLQDLWQQYQMTLNLIASGEYKDD